MIARPSTCIVFIGVSLVKKSFKLEKEQKHFYDVIFTQLLLIFGFPF